MGDKNLNTFEALEEFKSQKQKRIERAQKYGIVTKEVLDEKKLER